MQNSAGIQVRTTAEIDASCTIEHEVSGEEVFFAFADGTVALHFAGKEAFRNFMGEAVQALAKVGISDGEPSTVSVG